MNIGFDAKRAFHNTTGLGHYSRSLIASLAEYFPEHTYYLFNPKPSTAFKMEGPQIREIRPHTLPDRLFPSFWRSNTVKKDLRKQHIDIYHGLSHEIPLGMPRTGIPSVVTMHDLIHERYPEQYNRVDVRIYRKKFRYACRHADRVIAISEQTRQDLIDFYQTPPGKISVCYQSCNPAFAYSVSPEKKESVKRQYGLPDRFFLYVGSVIERKNLLRICEAMSLLDNVSVPLVVIGNGGAYMRQVREYVRANRLESRILFMADNPAAQTSPGFRTAADFPAIYQQAIALIYPSFFEGFGIPVLEALWSRLPVITSNRSCLPEVGGEGAHYVNPESAEEIAAGMHRLLSDIEYADQLREKGWQQARRFTPFKSAESVMQVYKSLC